MDMRYDWRFSAPGAGLHVHMENWRDGRSAFDATLNLKREEISECFARPRARGFPLITTQVTTLIHWQALKLWMKRTPFSYAPEEDRAAVRGCVAEESARNVSRMNTRTITSTSRPSFRWTARMPQPDRGLAARAARPHAAARPAREAAARLASASSSREGEHRFGKRSADCDLAVTVHVHASAVLRGRGVRRHRWRGRGVHPRPLAL